MGKILNALNSGIKSSNGQQALAQYHNKFNQFLTSNPNSFSQGTNDAAELAVYTSGNIALINSALNRKMSDVRNRDFFFKRKGKRIEWKDVPDEIRTPLEAGYAGLSLPKLLAMVCGHEDLTGNALWLKDVDTNLYTQAKQIPGRFIPITPGNFKIKLTPKEDAIEYYTITWADGSQKQYPKEMVIHFKRDALKCPYIGIGLVSQSRSLIEYETVAQQYQTTFMEKDGTPDLIYIDKDAASMQPEMVKNAGDQLRSEYNAGRYANSVMYVPGNVDVKSFAISSSDLQYIEGRNFNKEDLISIMESTAVVIGREKDAGNYSIANKSTQNYFMRVNGRIYDFLETLNMQFVWAVRGFENKEYELSFEPYATGDIDEINKAVNGGLMSPYDGAKSMGYSVQENNEAAKSLYVGAGLRTLQYAYDTQPINMSSMGLAMPDGSVKKKPIIRDYE